MLPGEANAAANFLRSKLGSQVTIRKSEIQVDAEKSDEVKFLIKKFQHREGLETYRVTSESGVITVVLEKKEEPMRKKTDDKVNGGSALPTPLVGAFAADGNCLS